MVAVTRKDVLPESIEQRVLSEETLAGIRQLLHGPPATEHERRFSLTGGAQALSMCFRRSDVDASPNQLSPSPVDGTPASSPHAPGSPLSKSRSVCHVHRAKSRRGEARQEINREGGLLRSAPRSSSGRVGAPLHSPLSPIRGGLAPFTRSLSSVRFSGLSAARSASPSIASCGSVDDGGCSREASAVSIGSEQEASGGSPYQPPPVIRTKTA